MRNIYSPYESCAAKGKKYIIEWKKSQIRDACSLFDRFVSRDGDSDEIERMPKGSNRSGKKRRGQKDAG